MRLKIEIYVHFQSKEQLTMTHGKCLLYVFESICIIFIKKTRGCCVKLEMCCICILEPKKADHTFCFSQNVSSVSAPNLVMRELSGPFYKKRRGMMLC